MDIPPGDRRPVPGRMRQQQGLPPRHHAGRPGGPAVLPQGQGAHVPRRHRPGPAEDGLRAVLGQDCGEAGAVRLAGRAHQ
eukprot:10024912-Alexandrium_andersonii.AAC.1